MDTETALPVLSALSQPSRLAIFRLLVRHEPQGLAAGEVARHLVQPQNTISAHLAILQRAGLVSTTRNGRFVSCRAEPSQVEALAAFLLAECCAENAAQGGSCPPRPAHREETQS
ncbi:ArsR/SmtB family transcription factor [Swaminathania salitolerans]|uniref:Transcriptional regulator n=1 Tax=Swaminathania salitolerans TaxID=182838 RepID=A0A511BRR7_9PROT|nr:metalloregulator ArsR/SmtB family transcription factor [Swaminathania salitolerans]GBQ11563.1 ArsR family transcriptional regulator [Swaminathania salitolerans LMG 21291]GEL02533.1 transcriptional regulator [Swaminathania salitolerans]